MISTEDNHRLQAPTSWRESRTGNGFWKQNLYLLQERAPKPHPVICTNTIDDRPQQYADEFHGLIPRSEADRLLTAAGEGAYLVRQSQRSTDTATYTLCMRFDGNILNYKLFFDGSHFVGEKRFESMDELVADGLISMYMDKHAAEYIKRMADEAVYEESPYIQYQKSMAVPGRTRNSSSSNQLSLVDDSKCHRFQPHTFRIPHYCDFCRNFMWGLVQQGLRCDDCGFAAHKRCSEKSINRCRPDIKYVRRMFAVDLTTLCMAHSVLIPPVVQQCIDEIELRGLDVEGIYRISGSHEEIEKLRQSFDTCASLGQHIDLSATKVDDVHSVTGLLKLYLRMLPQPLVTFSFYRDLLNALNASRNTHERLKTCRRSLAEMAPTPARTLYRLLQHLNRVADHSATNKMTMENLATVFAPTLLCSGVCHAGGVMLPQQEQRILQFLIVNYEKLLDNR